MLQSRPIDYKLVRVKKLKCDIFVFIASLFTEVLDSNLSVFHFVTMSVAYSGEFGFQRSNPHLG